MVSSRRSSRVKARKEVAKGSPGKVKKNKNNSNNAEENGGKTREVTKKKGPPKPSANDGTKPTQRTRKKGENQGSNGAQEDLTGDDNDKWEGHMDREHAAREKTTTSESSVKAKARTKERTKNAFVQAINEGIIRIDDSDEEDSDEEEEVIFYTEDNTNHNDTEQKDGPLEDDPEGGKPGNKSGEGEETGIERDMQNEVVVNDTGSEKEDDASMNQEDNGTRKNNEPVKSNKVGFDEDDIGMEDLENGDHYEMEIDENETPAGELRILEHPNIETECRYSFVVTTKPSTKPFQSLREQIVKFLKNMQEQVGKEVYVGQWDLDGGEEVETIKKPDDMPKLTGMTKARYAAYFNGYPSPKRNQEVTMFLRIRLVTDKPEKLAVPLAKIGQVLYDDSPEGLGINIGRNPYPCQACDTVTLGWLFGSTKSIDSTTFEPALRKKLGLPDHVPLGVQWRTMKSETRKQYKWNREDHPPQAIHVDIDKEYANRYYNIAAKLFKKRSHKRILGMRLRIVPCLGSERAKTLTDVQKENTKLMHAKQQYLCNSHVSRIETNHILNLDRPVGHLRTTLRKYLMSRAPKDSITQRLFMSVDPAWKGKGYILVTTKPHYKEAMDMLNSMIPECVHAYGLEAAQTWFTNSGLEAYRGVKWDPRKKSTSSNRDYESISLVAEDIFELGDEWRMKAPILQQHEQQKRDESFVQQTVEAALDKRADDSDIHSFGSVMGRSHEGDTIASKKPEETLDLAHNQAVIQFEGMKALKDLETDQTNTGESIAGTSAAFTTDSVRERLKQSEETNARLLKENKELANARRKDSDDDKSTDHTVTTTKTTQSTKARCNALSLQVELQDDALEASKREIEELKRLLAAQKNPPPIEPAPNEAKKNQTTQALGGPAVTTNRGDGKG